MEGEESTTFCSTRLKIAYLSPERAKAQWVTWALNGQLLKILEEIFWKCHAPGIINMPLVLACCHSKQAEHAGEDMKEGRFITGFHLQGGDTLVVQKAGHFSHVF